MKGIFEAEIFVETVFSIESYQNNGTWFYMSDYSTMSEFLTDCGNWFNSQSELTSIRASAEIEQDSTLLSACRKFSDESHPEYLYLGWWDGINKNRPLLTDEIEGRHKYCNIRPVGWQSPIA